MINEIKEEKACWLTSKENPYNCFTRFDDWYKFDTEIEHLDTCGKIARNCFVSSEMSNNDWNRALSDCIDDMLEHNPVYKWIYRKVDENSEFKIN